MPAMSLIGANGSLQNLLSPGFNVTAQAYPLPDKRSHHSFVPACPSTPSIMPMNSSLFATRAALLLYRGSFSHSGLFSTAGEHKMANCVSLPAESMMKLSLVGKTW